MVPALRSLVRLLLPHRVAAGKARRLFHRTAAVGDAMDPGDDRTVLLGTEMSAEEIARELYERDFTAGGWLFDMGLWRGHYIRRATKIINHLAAREPDQVTSPTSADLG